MNKGGEHLHGIFLLNIFHINFVVWFASHTMYVWYVSSAVCFFHENVSHKACACTCTCVPVMDREIELIYVTTTVDRIQRPCCMRFPPTLSEKERSRARETESEAVVGVFGCKPAFDGCCLKIGSCVRPTVPIPRSEWS